jgi:hypothetical protein
MERHMKRIIVLLLAVLGAGRLEAQQTDAGIVAKLRDRGTTQVADRPERNCGNRGVHVAGMTAVGAVSGWAMFTFGIGLLASDHGSEYKRVRNQFMLYGALLGAGIGSYQVATDSCIRPRRRR